jgi:hypothetical protein
MKTNPHRLGTPRSPSRSRRRARRRIRPRRSPPQASSRQGRSRDQAHARAGRQGSSGIREPAPYRHDNLSGGSGRGDCFQGKEVDLEQVLVAGATVNEAELRLTPEGAVRSLAQRSTSSTTLLPWVSTTTIEAQVPHDPDAPPPPKESNLKPVTKGPFRRRQIYTSETPGAIGNMLTRLPNQSICRANPFCVSPRGPALACGRRDSYTRMLLTTWPYFRP